MAPPRVRARLTPWRWAIRQSVAFIWIATALISAVVYPVAESLKLLAAVGVTGQLAPVALYGTCALELAIGVAMALGWRVRLMGAIGLALIAGFTAILSVGMPELWIHPFGPLTKNAPIVGATIAMIALADD